MSEEPVKRENIAKRLIFVGDINPTIIDISAMQSEYPVFNGVTIEHLTVEAFLHASSRNSTSKNQIDLFARQCLSVIVTDETACFDKALFINTNLFVIALNDSSYANVSISSQFSAKNLASSVNMGFQFLFNNRLLVKFSENIITVSRERKELSEIGIALSAERDLEKLLTRILKEGRNLGNCEAASLYLLNRTNKSGPQLVFKLTQNSKIDFDFSEMTFPLTKGSLAGYVALTGEILNIVDAYKLSTDLAYRFDKSFDETTGYRTRELLVLPMKNHKGKVIGVLQFINQKDHRPGMIKTQGFSTERQELLMGLASQSAVAIDNSQLIENIQALFEGFVSASVKAIESRDPVTSGHSFRVAEFTTGLAKSLDRLDSGLYRHTKFDKQHLQEIRYASLLHDFGKVGVKENVLLKANKLDESRYQYLDLKIEWQKQLIQRRYYQQLMIKSTPGEIRDWQNSTEFQQMQATLNKLKHFQKILMQANKPSLMEKEVAVELEHLLNFQMDQSFPYDKSLISQHDFLSLSVTRGSLTEQERIEIQSHVVHTEAFLSEIPWTDELAAIPLIAGSHHEKLDGTGYPRGICDQEIPVASKIMAVADIYDALTASDRPYKKAVKTELALDILKEEAERGKLCDTMVETFITAKVYQKLL